VKTSQLLSSINKVILAVESFERSILKLADPKSKLCEIFDSIYGKSLHL
jgi:hypothetical protein